MTQPQSLLLVGRIGKPHGLKGLVHVDLTTDRTERLDIGAACSPARSGCRSRPPPATVRRGWSASRASTAATGAERIANRPLRAEPIDDPDALWVHEMVGAPVIERDGTPRGRCVAVVANPAHDLLELDSGALVPVTFVVEMVDGTITIEPPDGLFEIAE